MSAAVPSITPFRSKRRVLLTALTAVAFSIASFAFFTPRAEAIVNGQLASQEYPHMAAFLKDGNQICGASLIAPQWIVSAAHCVDSLDPSHYSFRIGGAPDLAEPGGETIQAAQVIVHPDYTDTYDVVLFQLERPSVYEPISLADPVADRHLWEPGDNARVIGYGGQFFQTPSIDEQLREVDVPVVSDADCDTSYQLTFGGIDENVEVCAGNLYGAEDSCQGDSGGPLMVPDESGKWLQIGVVSWGFGCAFPTQYGVYSRVGDQTLNSWIHETIANTDIVVVEPPPPDTTTTTTVKVEPQGYILASNPVFSITEDELSTTCSTNLLTQGLDGYAWQLPSELAVPGAVAQVTGDALIYDLDIAFYGVVNGVCTRLAGSLTGDVNEKAPVPAGTEYVIATNWLGVDALADLTVEIPDIDSVSATTLELSPDNTKEGQFNQSVTFSAQLKDATGTPLADRAVRFALVNGAGEAVQFAGGSPTDANGVSEVAMQLGVPAGDYTLEAVFIGDPERYSESSASAPFTGLAADTATAVAATGNGASKQVTATLTEAASATPVVERTIEFFANCESIGTATTAADGTATIEVPARSRAATTQFSAVFVGDEGDRYYNGSRGGLDY